MGKMEDDTTRAEEYDKYNLSVRQRMQKEDEAAQKVQIDCANEILSALSLHIKEQMNRYGKGEAKYATYSQLKQELETLSQNVLLTKPGTEDRGKNIERVIDIMKRTGEASQERRQSFWDSVYHFITGNKVEVKSWRNFKETIEQVKEKIQEKRDQQALYSRAPDYAKDLFKATKEATQEINDDSSPKKTF